MIASLEQARVASAWTALLELRRHLQDESESARDEPLYFVKAQGHWQFQTTTPAPTHDVVRIDRSGAASADLAGVTTYCEAAFAAGREPMRSATPDQDPAHTAFRLYLPIVLAAARARQQGGSFRTAHLAQTLDGRIACWNGHSQWISNEANLHHAHRLRALHDGVLVGRRTLETDDPRLTVRHVPGANPRRIVLSAGGELLRDPREYQAFHGDGATVVIAAHANQHAVRARPGLEVLTVDTHEDILLKPKDVSAVLAARGLHSVFLEGGAVTISSFLAAHCVDLLHLHLAPLILGSGLGSFVLPRAERISEAMRMTMTPFRLDGELLLECRPIHNA